MKKFLSLVTLLVMTITMGGYVHAQNVYTLSCDKTIEQSTSDYFTIAGKTNSKYGGATYDGKTYTEGLKIDSNGSITFTSTAKCTLTIIQSLVTNDKNVFNVDGKPLENRTDDTTNKIGTYTKTGLEADTHTITKGSGEAGIIYVKVEYEETKTIESTVIELTNVKINNNDISTENLQDLLTNKTLTLTDKYTTTPNVVFVQNTTYKYTDNSSDNFPKDINAEVSKGDDNYVATATIDNTTYTINLPINKDVTVEAPTYVAVNGTVVLSCATEGVTLYYKIGDGEYQEYKRPFTILDKDATVTAKAVFGEKETACEPFTVEAVKCTGKVKTLWFYYDTNKFDIAPSSNTTNVKPTITGKTGTDCEGYTIEMNKANKTYGYYNDLTINGNTYKTIKLSNGAENILKMPEGIKANRITIYSIINAENDSKVSGWKNVNGDQEYTKIPMGAYQGSGTDYDVRVYSLNNVTSQISFTNIGTQLGFVVALDIVDESEATADITIGENKMATYCNASAWTVPSEFEVYTAKYADSKVKLTKVEEGKVIKAGEGVVLYGEAKTYTVNLSTETGEELDNSLVGVTEDTKIDNETTYVLVKGTNGVCFGKLASGQTVTAGKAYLTINDENAAKTLSVDFGTTGINAVENAIDTVNGAYYTLSGQRTVKPVKGMYIHNGKKYIAK